MLTVPQDFREVQEGQTRHLLQAAFRGAPVPGPPSLPPRGVGVGGHMRHQRPPPTEGLKQQEPP